jgi:PTH2 family peptidyl-tRNA hydrolase
MKRLKMVIVVRKDVEMGRGKLGGQVAHAACGLVYDKFNLFDTRQKVILYNWMQDGQTKAVLRVDNEIELRNILEAAIMAELPYYPVRDAGHTQLEPGTFTCVGIGPEYEEKIDQITGHLRLY